MPAQQQTLPPLAAQAANLFKSVVAFVGDGCGIVDETRYAARLEICRTCGKIKEGSGVFVLNRFPKSCYVESLRLGGD